MLKTRSGMSLIELIIAVAVLAVAISGIFTAFYVGFSTSSKAHDITLASIEAQLQMERLVGRTWGDLVAVPPGADPTATPPVSVGWGEPFLGIEDDLWVRVLYWPYHARNGHSVWQMGNWDIGLNWLNGLEKDEAVPNPRPGCNNSAFAFPGVNCIAGDCYDFIDDDLSLVQVTVYVYLTEQHAIDHINDHASGTWIIRHRNILNVLPYL